MEKKKGPSTFFTLKSETEVFRKKESIDTPSIDGTPKEMFVAK